MKLAFLGLGKMGSGMAHNLLRAGHARALFGERLGFLAATIVNG